MRKWTFLFSLVISLTTLVACQDNRQRPMDPQRQERNALEPAQPGPINPGR
jgi:hypothetical protein